MIQRFIASRGIRKGIKRFAVLGAINASLAFIVAEGAHRFSSYLPASFADTFEIAFHYQVMHGMALAVAMWFASRLVPVGSISRMFGLAVFCTGLYTLAFTGITKLNDVAPAPDADDSCALRTVENVPAPEDKYATLSDNPNQVIYLNRNGGKYSRGSSDNASVDRSSIVPGDIKIPA